MKTFPYLLLLVLGSISCQPIDMGEERQQLPGKLLRSIEQDGEAFSTYTYFPDGRLQSYTINTTTFAYRYAGDSMQLETMNQDGSLRLTEKYYPSSNNVVRKDQYNAQGDLREYWHYFFNDFECFFVGIGKYRPNGELYEAIVIERDLNDCSYTATTKDSNGETQNSEAITRGDGNDPLQVVLLDFLGFDQVLLNGSYTFSDAAGEIDESRSYTAEFTFNTDNYPVWERRTFLNGEVQILNYYY
ncbi:MAG: hypothetical protein AAF206_28800 [Bacteroidota bacterium]